MTEKNYSRDGVMAVELDAGRDRDGKERHLYAVLDSGANVVDVVVSGGLSGAGYETLPVFGPLDVKAGVYREMLRQKRLGNPKIQQRRGGRWSDRPSRQLGATLGERSPGALKHRLLRGGKKR